ncbi:MAG TPA: putative glycoside hydrolase [Terriglobales bacterium]|nr:putative glycoside hydrolase [Terriglobales bacterium]
MPTRSIRAIVVASLMLAACAAQGLAFFYRPPSDGTPVAAIAAHFQLVILTHTDEPYMAELRAAGFRGPILQYIAANETEGPGPYPNARARCDRRYPTYQRTVADRVGVFCASIHPHEAWFLHNLAGARLWTRYQSANGVWRTTYLMNPASSGWRRFLIARLKQYRQLGFSGFFLDNVALSRAGLEREPADRGGVREFPAQAGLRHAELAYLAALRRSFPGVPLWANLIQDPGTPASWDGYLPFLDGVMVENFALGWNGSPLDPASRIAQARKIAAALARGVHVIAVMQGKRNDSARLAFGLALRDALAPPPGSRAQLYFRYNDAFDEDYRTVWWSPAAAAPPPPPLGPILWGPGPFTLRRQFRSGWLSINLDSATSSLSVH